jgi:excisionase family DNA binding protein
MHTGIYDQCQLVQPDWEKDLQDRWRSLDEIAQDMGVSIDGAYAWVTQKDVPGHKVGRCWKFQQQNLDRWVRGAGAVGASAGTQDE